MITKIIKKEFNLFLSRKAMVKWYIVLIAINALAVFLPIKPDIAILENHAISAIIYMSVTVLLVPNNLSLDVIGGEKMKGTLETLLSSPISCQNIFIGKSVYIIMLTIVAAIGMTILDNVLLYFCYGTTFMNCGLSGASVAALYLMIVISAVILSFLGTVLSLTIKNLKLAGYIVALAELAIILFIYSSILQNDLNLAYAYAAIISLLCIYIYFGIVKRLRKSQIMMLIK